MNQEKLTEINNISQEQKEKGKKRGGLKRGLFFKMLPGLMGGQTTPSCSSVGAKNTPCGSLAQECAGISPPKAIYGDLEERCRTGTGLGVSLLRLWLGERPSPCWPLREARSPPLCWSRGGGWGEGQ